MTNPQPVSFPAKAGNIPFENQYKTRMPSFTTPIQHSIGGSDQGNYARERKKDIQIGREEVKCSLFPDDVIVYLETPLSQPKISLS